MRQDVSKRVKRKELKVAEAVKLVSGEIESKNYQVFATTKEIIKATRHPTPFLVVTRQKVVIQRIKIKTLLTSHVNSFTFNTNESNARYQEFGDAADDVRDVQKKDRTTGKTSLKRSGGPLPNQRYESRRSAIEDAINNNDEVEELPDEPCGISEAGYDCAGSGLLSKNHDVISQGGIKTVVNRPRGFQLTLNGQSIRVCWKCKAEFDLCKHGKQRNKCMDQECRGDICKHGKNLRQCLECYGIAYVCELRRKRRLVFVTGQREVGNSSTFKMLRMPPVEWLEHLVESFNDTYGTSYTTYNEIKNKEGEIHIDEIIPCSKWENSFDNKYCWHWKNSQLLRGTDNSRKSNKCTQMAKKKMMEEIDSWAKENDEEWDTL